MKILQKFWKKLLPRQDRRFSRRLHSQNPLLTDRIYTKFREGLEFELRLAKSAKKGGKTLKYFCFFGHFLYFFIYAGGNSCAPLDQLYSL